MEPPPTEAPSQNFSGFHARIGHPFTFGLIFVKNYGDQPAVLDSVELEDDRGGIALVGSLAADITGQHHTWSSDDNFPPKHPTGQMSLSGFSIAPSTTETVQILVGIALSEAGQHGFREVALLYHVGEDQYRYAYPSGAVACSASFYADDPGSSCDSASLFGWMRGRPHRSHQLPRSPSSTTLGSGSYHWILES